MIMTKLSLPLSNDGQKSKDDNEKVVYQTKNNEKVVDSKDKNEPFPSQKHTKITRRVVS